MANPASRKVNPDERAKTRAYGRQSKNIEDFRDTYTGPKKFKGKTRRVQAENTKGKLAGSVQNNSVVTDNEVPLSYSRDLDTDASNAGMNYRRAKQGVQVGQAAKNRKLGNINPATAKFFKHKQTDNL